MLDMWDSELPGYHSGFVDGGAMMTMCSCKLFFYEL